MVEWGGYATGDKAGAVVALELGELAAVDDARDDLVGGDGRAEVRAGDAGEFFGVVEGFFEGGWRRGLGGPVQVADGAPREDERVRVVHGQVVRHAGDGAVQSAAAEVFGRDDFAGGGFD